MKNKLLKIENVLNAKEVKNNIIKLSKKVIRQLPKMTCEGKEIDKYPDLMGAIIYKDKQYISNTYFVVRYNKITPNTINADSNSLGEMLSSFFINNKVDNELSIDLEELKTRYNSLKQEKDKDIIISVNIKNTLFNAEYLIDILNTFIYPKFYLEDNKLYITAKNGEGILCARRNNDMDIIIK